ncbi:MAG: stage II sporulation protein R [Clostridiales bacterium]|nr:stage II sporulation protein R [Clostridiales bacterium]
MKKLIILLLIAILFFGMVGCSSFDDKDCLRIHIRANSNQQVDQNVKYMVKDAVVEYLSPLLADATDKNKAKQIVTANCEQICMVANNVLQKNGFNYKSSAKVTKEIFPTRAYGGFVLENGEYDALILNLGNGSGDNWWCVVYPPLCFVDGEMTGGKLVYKSKLQEIIQKYFK